LKELVEFLVRSLVDRPDEVTVTESGEDGSLILEIRVAPEDAGKVIGRGGRIIRAIRTVTRAAAGCRGKHVAVEVVS